jgi:hypothetical protein
MADACGCSAPTPTGTRGERGSGRIDGIGGANQQADQALRQNYFKILSEIESGRGQTQAVEKHAVQRYEARLEG